MGTMHDVIIVGAGPGGSSTAHYLAKQGLDVVLLDKSEFPRDKTCGDALTPRALNVLDDMGLLGELHSIGQRINGLEIHVSRDTVITAPIPEHAIYPNYMMIVPRLKLDNLILQGAIESGAKFQSPVRVRSIEQNPDGVVIRGDHKGQSITAQARLVILSIGANIKIPLRMGILKKAPTMIKAARGYYEGLAGLNENIQAHFENIPLPGYGWVFPTSQTAANIGAGFWKPFLPWKKPPTSARAVMDDFLSSPALKDMLANAELVSPIKGYPLRIDFATAPTFSDRVLLVGETAGLVSPLTGEGIDLALESGKLAAEYLEVVFRLGDFSSHGLQGYDTLLRDHFQRLFIFSSRIRQIYINPILMNRTVRAAQKFPELKSLLINVMMGESDAANMVDLPVIRKVLFNV